MDPICISAAAVLRCSSLTTKQNIIFIVPVALEFLVSCLLFFLKWGSGKQHLLLVTEGWTYFILSLLELHSVVLFPLSSGNINQFRSFDIGIGITSFLPLFLYTLFLYLFTCRELLSALPKYAANVAKVSMLLSLPVIIATNEVASVTGIKITFNSTEVVPSITFTTKHDEWLWLFFTSLTLAILTAYQVTVFSLSFCRFIWILVQRRKGSHDIALGGMGWFSAGVKLGALEAIIGFAGGSFEVSMTRRVMRFVGRTFLCIGLITVNPVTEITRRSYDNLERPEKIGAASPRIRGSRPHPIISDPRFSTFRELSPVASKFHTALRGPGASWPMQTSSRPTVGFKTPHYLTFSQRQRLVLSESGLSDVSRSRTVVANAQQRVTVCYEVQGGPPLLQMRLSALGEPLIPCPPVAVQVKGVYLSPEQQFADAPRNSSLFDMGDVLPIPKPPFAHERGKSRSSRESSLSITPSVVEIVNGPRRTISQRRADARLFHARAGDQIQKQESKRASTFYRESPEPDAANSPVSRPCQPSPGPLFSFSRFSHTETSGEVYRRPETQSVSLKSVSDSLQAVQELAGQFPALPTAASVDRWVDGVRSDSPICEENGATSRHSPFVHAIGSPTDLGLPTSPSYSVSRKEIVSLQTEHLSSQSSNNEKADGVLPSEEDIIWTSRHESGSQSPSSSRTSYSIVTMRESNGSVDTSPVSKWMDDDSFNQVIHDASLNTSEEFPTTTAKDRFVAYMKPIVIPRRRSNLPEVIQCWDDGS